MMPAARRWTLGALAAAAGWRWLPADAFHGTLVILPLVVVALVELERWARGHGGRPTPPRVVAAEVAALGLLLLVTSARGALGLGSFDELLAAAFALLLALRVARLALALRPSLGRQLGGPPPLPFLCLPLVVYLAILPWMAGQRPPDGDEPYYLLITHSLAYDGDTDLADNYQREDSRTFMDRALAPQPGDPVGPAGERYSRHSATLPLLLAPAYRLAGKWGAMAVMALLTATLAWALLLLAGRHFPDCPGAALLVWALFSFTPPLLLYSHQIWVEVPAALLLTLALERIWALGEGRVAGWRGWTALALPLLLLPLLKLRFLLLTAPLLLLAVVRGRRARWATAGVAGLAVVAAGGILLRNQALFGNPLRYRSLAEISLFSYGAADYFKGLTGLFFDCAFGLFASATIWLLLLAALPLLVARRPRLAAELGLLAVPLLVFVAPRTEWFGGWSPPFRYGLALLPPLALCLVPLLARRRRSGARLLLVLLGAATLGLTLLWIAVPTWTYSLAHGRNDLLDLLARQTGLDFARFFPSSVRPRLATWVWPPAALLLVNGLWWSRPRPRASTAAWAAVLTLALAAALPLAARRVPTRVVELEDPWVGKQGGELYPGRWVTARPTYRGGWAFGPGSRAEAPLVAGGGELTVVVVATPRGADRGALRLEVYAGDRLVGDCSPERTGWQRIELGPFPFTPGDTLGLRVRALDPGAEGSILVDRALLTWGPGAP